MEIETQRQSAFFLFVGHGNRFVEEILAPPLSFDSVLTKKHLLSRLAEATRFCSSAGCIHIMGDAI
jgi:hypothetical protein